MTIHFSCWLSGALNIMLDLRRIGFDVTDEDIRRLIQSSIYIEVCQHG